MKVFVYKICSVFIIFLAALPVHTQNRHRITATLQEEENAIAIQQEILFYNPTPDTLQTVYLLDWNHAYASKRTALAARFAEDFDRRLHFAGSRERGRTQITAITDKNNTGLQWERTDAEDIIKIALPSPLYPNQEITLQLSYTTHLPDSKFTSYGHTGEGNYNLRYWYLSPAVYTGEGWKLYSNKDLDDLFTLPATYHITFRHPPGHDLITDLTTIEKDTAGAHHKTVLEGIQRADIRIFLEKQNSYTTYKTAHFNLISNIESKRLSEEEKTASVIKVIDFITEKLGPYPHQKLLVSETEYKKNPLYGLNQLPSFLRPFPENFQYELKLLKTVLNNYLENTVYIDPRGDRWVTDAIQTYLMIAYKESFYPDMKLIGKLSDDWLVRGFYLAQMDFNDQYPFLYMLMARKNIDQPLSTPRDSLIKFNEKIANKYKAGLGLKYIEDYTGEKVDSALKYFYKKHLLKKATPEDFETILKARAAKNIDWFFEEYVPTRHKIDFKIQKITEIPGDSLRVTVKNKRGTNVPVSLFGIRNDSVVSKHWLNDIKTEKTFEIPKQNAERLVLNYNKVIPEFNQRNNWKSVKKGFLFNNKPLQFRFFKDAENPFYNQVFHVPIFTYNLYDGITPGLRLYNKSLIERPFLYDIRPSYAMREKALVGGVTFWYRQYVEDKRLYIINYSLRGSTSHYAENLRYSTITPAIYFGFRPADLRSNEKQFISMRNINVFRDRSSDIDTDPDYSVFNARYIYSNNNILNYLSSFTDLQIAKNFSKLAFTIEYRRLFQNNRQLNLRLFAGKFIHNTTNSDFFSFALDRPTDYLFDYNYLGRSEDSGLYSQQIIIAEGGFKSRLDDAFANDWILTGNSSINLWRWIELYGDIGFVKNKNSSPAFVYDSGIRLNLVTDYFELYLPLYSNNGWEIAQSDYSEKIRFIITLSPKTLIGLFTRKWF